jgi:hypothetical protein
METPPPPLSLFQKQVLAKRGFLLVDIPPIDPDFLTIQQTLQIPNYNHPQYPLIIERVYNPGLESRFKAQVAEITAKRGGSPHILFPMFHGTTEAALNTIMQSGFDPTYNRVSMYGKGTYFSSSCMMSARYSKMDAYGYQIMFVCKVIQGNHKPGHQDEKPDTKSYDSYDNGSTEIVVSPYPAGGIPLFVIRWYKAIPGAKPPT